MPWPSDDDQGFINVHAMGKGSDGKTFWTGRPARDVDQFLQIVHGMLAWRTPPDIYFCMSRQARTKLAKDNTIRAAKSQDQALALKGIWLDIDIKPKGFPTLTAAVNGLTEFCTKFKLPLPTAMVMSGGGLHAHWINTKCMTVAEWTPYAEGLKAAAIEFFGQRMDTGVIADCARVLRIPGTFNFKQDTPRPVRLLGMKDQDYDFDKELGVLIGLCSSASVVPVKPALAGRPSVLFCDVAVESLAEGIGRTEYPPLDWTPIVKECGWFREALSTGGKDFSQGLWNLTTLAATFMEDGNALAHRMARGYPGYLRLETDELWDRKLAERRDRSLGWPSCRAIQGEGCGHCASCPHLVVGKSPLNLAGISKSPNSMVSGMQGAGQPPVPAAVANSPSGAPGHGAAMGLVHLTDLDLPPKYMMQQDIIHRVIETKETGQAPTYTYLPLFHSRLYNPWAQSHPDALHFTTSVDKGSYRDVTLMRSKLTAVELNTVLYSSGVMPRVENEKYVREFLVSWYSKLDAAAAAKTNVPFGWHMDGNECKGFSYGSVLYKADGTLGPVGMTDPELKDIYGPQGDEQPWMDCLNMITAQNRYGLQVIVAAGFGAPLMFATGEYSVLMSVFGDSGAGKSTAARVSTAIWAKPILAKEVETATTKSVIHKLGQIRNLPYYWDEIKNDSAQKKAYDVLYVASAGSEGGRLHANITQQTKGTWNTICGIFSNPSFGDFIIKQNPNTTAGLMRVFEWCEQKPAKKSAGQIGRGDVSRMLFKLDDNYGQIGRKYAAWLGPNRDTAWTVVKRYNDFFEKVTDDPDRNTNDERFWIAFCSAVCAGAEIANQVVGTNFDVPEIVKFLVQKLKFQRTRSIEENMQGGSFEHTEMMLTNFLKAMTRRTAVTEMLPFKKLGKPQPIHLERMPQPGEPCQVQWVKGAGLLMFSKTEFNRWLRQDDVRGDPRALMEGLKNHFKSTVDRGTLCKGTKITCGQEPIVTIPVKKDGPLWELLMNEPSDTPVETGAGGLSATADTAGLFANPDAPSLATPQSPS